MATNPPKRQAAKPKRPVTPVIQWLLDSDPSIRWQVMRDLIGAPAGGGRGRARAGRHRGLGRSAARPAGGRRVVGRRGVEPRVGLHDARPVAAARNGSRSRKRRGAACGGPGARPRAWRGWDWDGTWRGWDFVGNPFFAGEVEPCINGQVAASGAYFGRQDIQRIIDRLLGEQLPDGGWNCEAENGSTRSSFNTTICVLEALLEYELAGGVDETVESAPR